MSKLSLASLSAEERKSLKAEALEDLKNDQLKTAEDRKAYKALVNECVPKLFEVLVSVSKELGRAKKTTYDGLKSLIAMKQDVYGKDGDQYSHSFTTEKGMTIIVGYRISDGWDDTVTAGLNKMDKFLASLAKDENSKMLIRVIKKLLAKDAKGNLKSSRVLSLKKEAEGNGNPEFLDAINIIMAAYQPVKSKLFVTVRYKAADGSTIDLPLDITAAEMPEEKEG